MRSRLETEFDLEGFSVLVRLSDQGGIASDLVVEARRFRFNASGQGRVQRLPLQVACCKKGSGHRVPHTLGSEDHEAICLKIIKALNGGGHIHFKEESGPSIATCSEEHKVSGEAGLEIKCPTVLAGAFNLSFEKESNLVHALLQFG